MCCESGCIKISSILEKLEHNLDTVILCTFTWTKLFWSGMETEILEGVEWIPFDTLKSSVRVLPRNPGVIRIPSFDGDETFLVVRDLQQWMIENRQDLEPTSDFPQRDAEVFWWVGSPKELENIIRGVQNKRNVLKAGRPFKIRTQDALQNCPHSWGVYRIHKKSDETYYVGISSNLKSRLYSHRRKGMFQLEDGDYIEVLLVGDVENGRITTWADLQRAENLHIERFKRLGKTVMNVTAGSNGRPPDVRMNFVSDSYQFGVRRSHNAIREEIWHLVDSNEKFIPGSEFPKVNIRVTWSDHRGDWDIYINPKTKRFEAYVEGKGGYGSPSEYVQLSHNWLRNAYFAQNFGRDFDLDFLEFGHDKTLDLQIKEEFEISLHWPKRRLSGDKLSLRADLFNLRNITATDLLKRELPRAIQDEGYVVDPDWNVTKNAGINPVMKIITPSNRAIYVKKEENAAAVRAECLASLLWNGLGWKGIEARSINISDDGLLHIPALGTPRVADLGSFFQYFHFLPFENSQSIASARARFIKRVTLKDLDLVNNQDVTRFLTVNAITGNTDRHSKNIHLGIDRDARSGGGRHYLLPIDHGRVAHNNTGRPSNEIYGTPFETISGQIVNPHQLLRPAAELLDADRREVLEVAQHTIGRVSGLLNSLVFDPGWEGSWPEIRSMLVRCNFMESNLEQFFDQISTVVM